MSDPHLQLRRLGRSSVEVPPFGLGTAPLGGLYAPLGDAEAAATLDRAAALRVGYIDTAPLYGYGLAEERVGALLRRSGSRPVISTKVGRVLEAAPALPDPSLAHRGTPFYFGTPPVTPVFDFSAAGIRRSLEESLERLGVAEVDIAFIHDPDAHFDQARSEAAPALAALKEEGLVGAIGVGMNQWEMLVELSELDLFDCFLLAGRYSLLDQSALDVLLPRCLDKGIAVIVGGVYNSGVLADPAANARYDYVPASAEVIERAGAIRDLAGRYGVPIAALATQFPLAHPAVASVLVGARTPAELEANLVGLDVAVPESLWQELRDRELILADAPVPP